MKEIIVHVVAFKRQKDSNWETGVAMGEGTGIIVDLEGKQPESIWEYTEQLYKGCFVIRKEA